MSKELKSLERIENYQVVADIEKDKTATIKELLPSSCEIIETAIKELDFYKKRDKQWKQDVNKNINKLKAFEIIKKIDKNALLQFISVCVKDQDKYDLLKEVLL